MLVDKKDIDELNKFERVLTIFLKWMSSRYYICFLSEVTILTNLFVMASFQAVGKTTLTFFVMCYRRLQPAGYI